MTHELAFADADATSVFSQSEGVIFQSFSGLRNVIYGANTSAASSHDLA